MTFGETCFSVPYISPVQHITLTNLQSPKKKVPPNKSHFPLQRPPHGLRKRPRGVQPIRTPHRRPVAQAADGMCPKCSRVCRPSTWRPDRDGEGSGRIRAQLNCSPQKKWPSVFWAKPTGWPLCLSFFFFETNRGNSKTTPSPTNPPKNFHETRDPESWEPGFRPLDQK